MHQTGIDQMRQANSCSDIKAGNKVATSSQLRTIMQVLVISSSIHAIGSAFLGSLFSFSDCGDPAVFGFSLYSGG